MQLNLQLQSQQLDILIVSDIHLNFGSIDKLSKQLLTNSYHFDYCFVGGDIANCDHETQSHNEQDMSQNITECLFRLYDILQCKILWIPGNHDPVKFFKGEQLNNTEIINIHKKQFVLQTGLRIIGLGGSLPAYLDHDSTSKEWSGYPYQNEAQFNEELQRTFKTDQIKTSKIFLTHIGPSISNTTVDRKKQYPVYAGSRSMNKLIQHEDLLLLIHGHVHNGGNYDKFKDKPVINPGALLYGQYAVLKLMRVNKVWKILKISFQKLI